MKAVDDKFTILYLSLMRTTLKFVQVWVKEFTTLKILRKLWSMEAISKVFFRTKNFIFIKYLTLFGLKSCKLYILSFSIHTLLKYETLNEFMQETFTGNIKGKVLCESRQDT